MTPQEVLDKALPPEQSNPSYGESSYWPMFGPHNWVQGHIRDATTTDGHGPYHL